MQKLLLLVTGILLSLFLLFSYQDTSTTSCLEFKQAKRTIEISCGNANIRDLYNAFGPSIIKNESQKVWVLNANVIIKDDATLYINSTDTLWLKINSTAGNAYTMISEGNLRIDSAKITSGIRLLKIMQRSVIRVLNPGASLELKKEPEHQTLVILNLDI